MLKFKNQDAYEARFRALQIVDERAAVKSVNGVLPDDAGAITLTPADINAVSVEDVANIRGAFRINVTYSGGVFSADKTFDEIKAAYDAGQQPYVVQIGGDAGVVYTFAAFTSQFVSFERYLIFGDTLKTVRLRIFPYTLENGSNIDRQTEAFDVASTGLPGAVRYDITQALSDTEKAQARANIGAGTSNFDGQYSSLTGQPTIPTKTSDLTNDSGFGTYSKPAGGIPKADLAEAVQTSLGKADTALQTHQSLAAYRKAAAQDVIDNTKLTDAPTDGKAYVRKNGSWSEVAVDSLQPKSITDSGGHFTSDTVEGALQEIGANLATETENRAAGDAAIQTAIENEIKPKLVRDFHVTGTASQDGYITAVTFKDGYPKSDLDNLITQGAKICLVVDHDAMSDYFNLSYSAESGYCGFSGVLLVTQDNTPAGQVIVYNGTDFTVYGNNAT